MSKKTYGLLSFAPIGLYILSLILIGIGAGLAYTGLAEAVGNDNLYVLAITAMVIAFIALILTYVVMVMLIVKACQNPHFTENKKIVWGLILFLLNMFVYPIFWYKYIYKEWDDERESQRPDLSIFWVAMPNILFIIMIYTFLGGLFIPGSGLIEEVLPYILTLVLLFLVTFVFISIVLFIIHACKNDELRKKKKIIWVLSFVFCSIFAFPLYWGMYIYKRKA